MGRPTAQLTIDLGWGRVLLQLDSDDLLDNPGEAQSAFYEGPGVSGCGGSGRAVGRTPMEQPGGEGWRASHSPGGTLLWGWEAGAWSLRAEWGAGEAKAARYLPYPQAVPQRRRCGSGVPGLRDQLLERWHGG